MWIKTCLVTNYEFPDCKSLQWSALGWWFVWVSCHDREEHYQLTNGMLVEIMDSGPSLLEVYTEVAVKQQQFLVIAKHRVRHQCSIFHYPFSQTSTFAEERILETEPIFKVNWSLKRFQFLLKLPLFSVMHHYEHLEKASQGRELLLCWELSRCLEAKQLMFGWDKASLNCGLKWKQTAACERVCTRLWATFCMTLYQHQLG